MNSPTCITNRDACDFVGNDCCVQEAASLPCWAPIHGTDSMKGEMSILVGGGVGSPFCDDFYNDFYGDVTEMRMYCGTAGRQFVEGLTTRYGPAPGSNIFAGWVKCMVDPNKILRISDHMILVLQFY